MSFKFLVFTLLGFLACYLTNAQTELWGTAPTGGYTGNGVIFSFTDSYNVHYEFGATYPGESPLRTQLVEVNSKFYGVVSGGGMYGMGLIFQYDQSSHTYTVVYTFKQISNIDGFQPSGQLILASNGKLYGTANGGIHGGGVLFEFDINTNTYLKVHDFQHSTGYAPNQLGMIEIANSKLLGAAALGGEYEGGVIFEFDLLTKTYTKKFDFSPSTGREPKGGLMQTATGKIYGTTSIHGRNDRGIIYEYHPLTAEVTVKKSFGENSDGTYAEGSHPVSPMIEHSNGKLYGLTSQGGIWAYGILFEYDPATNVVIKRMEFGPDIPSSADLATPTGGLLLASNGLFYGVTSDENTLTRLGGGFLFEFNPNTNLYRIMIEYTPAGSETLIQSSNGKLYGLSEDGCCYGKGSLFEYDINAEAYNTIFQFDFSPDGAKPYGTFVEAFDEKLYGMTYDGGENNYGTIYEFDPINKLFTKKSNIDGYKPKGSLTLHPNGKLYGTTVAGGSGSIIEFDPETEEATSIYEWSDAFSNGRLPLADLTVAPNGKMYGLTSEGGLNNKGVLFEYDLQTHTYAKKIDFSKNIGVTPKGTLTLASNGKLYGTTTYGGTGDNDFGTLFEYDYVNNVLTKKADFVSSTGLRPEGKLVSKNGKLYGTTMYGGSISGPGNARGVLFQYDIQTEQLSGLYNFTVEDGSHPNGSLTATPDGKLYGMTRYGGENSLGTIFKYDPDTKSYQKIYSFNGASGDYPEYNGLMIRKESQSLTVANKFITKQYGDAPFSLGVEATSGLELAYTLSNNNVVERMGDNFMIKNKGTVIITVMQLGNESYLPARWEEVEVIVTKGIVTVTAPQLTKVYGEEVPTIELTYSGLASNDTFTDLDSNPTITLQANSSSDVGFYDIILNGGSDDNYNFNLVNGILEITKAEQSISFTEFSNKFLGDDPFPIVAQSSSGLPLSFQSDDVAIAVIDGNNIVITGAGETTITANQNGNNNYFQASPVQRILQVQEIITDATEASEIEIKVFPNPTEGVVFIFTTGNVIGNIRVLDTFGNTIWQSNDSVEESQTISLLTFPPGIYILAYSSNGKTIFKRIIKV